MQRPDARTRARNSSRSRATGGAGSREGRPSQGSVDGATIIAGIAMAGRRPHDVLIGVGPALRKAREHRGLTLEEAARDTRLRLDQLPALESEDFDAMSGEVYVRASLRTYPRTSG